LPRRYRGMVMTVTRGVTQKDRRREGVLISTMRVSPSGRVLRAAYRKIGPRRHRVITAFWLWG
ncbi:MAG: hypothetical protein JRN13_07575, partial [Nitrososphaerota archaeon]|nr:hypothetical protein [Nitrososphaerota archaeon]